VCKKLQRVPRKCDVNLPVFLHLPCRLFCKSLRSTMPFRTPDTKTETLSCKCGKKFQQMGRYLTHQRECEQAPRVSAKKRKEREIYGKITRQKAVNLHVIMNQTPNQRPNASPRAKTQNLCMFGGIRASRRH
jgi:hypothetical protein